MSSQKMSLQVAAEYSQQSEKLSLQRSNDSNSNSINSNGFTSSPLPSGAAAVEALFVTPRDPVIVTADGTRLPGVPLDEAHRLNVLRDELREKSSNGQGHPSPGPSANGEHLPKTSADGTLRQAVPTSHTHPLFPPLPLYGPPSFMRNVQCLLFRISSFFLSLAFLSVIVLGSLFTSIAPNFRRLASRLRGRDPDADRPFGDEESRRARIRKQKELAWAAGKSNRPEDQDEFPPTEGGPDPVVADAAYYARRVGLDLEVFHVQTEDGFVVDLWHVYDPKEYEPIPEAESGIGGPVLFAELHGHAETPAPAAAGKRGEKYPVLLMHGLLQSAGAYCCTDDNSLAFWLCKSGFDVWLGNNRCGLRPRHTALEYGDPRMWCWNIRQMGVFDLPALVSRVRAETGFDKIGLICHSQGTTQTLVALAKEQRPDLGDHISVFCALAPAAYSGPLIGKIYFKFMRVIGPALFRLIFGIHAFIPFMMTMHSTLHPRLYGYLGYKVFWFLFGWTDTRWDRGLRDRMFQFAPVYVSSESMRWWLGRECFARHKCILSTREDVRAEEREDAVAVADDGSNRDSRSSRSSRGGGGGGGNRDSSRGSGGGDSSSRSKIISSRAARRCTENDRDGDGNLKHNHDNDNDNDNNGSATIPAGRQRRGTTAWYDGRAPPFAFWVAGNDDLVDGRKLLRRFERGREPHVRVVHAKVIPEYEHLDVIWATDSPQQVFREVREVLWKTCSARERCRVPAECGGIEPWVRPDGGEPGSDSEGQSLSDEERGV